MYATHERTSFYTEEEGRDCIVANMNQDDFLRVSSNMTYQKSKLHGLILRREQGRWFWFM